MKLGVVTSSISRQAGGLFHSVRRLAQSTAEAGIPVQVFGVRDEFAEEDLPAWKPLEPIVTEVQGPSRLAWSPGLAKQLAGISGPETLLHLHGIWQYASLACLRWRQRTKQPVVISPRGMLDPWALNNSPWRKRLVGICYEYRNLRGANCLHALADSEYQSMRAFGLKNPIVVSPNGVDIPSEEDLARPYALTLPTGWSDRRLLLFLSRVHPKKGLMPLLDAWARSSAVRKNWRLAIAGPDEVGHQAEVDRMIGELGLTQEVACVGPQYGEEKKAWLRRADAFILPSFSEGFPMAVLEAMAYRLPVVMTDECNFPEAFQHQVALRTQPEASSLLAALDSLAEMSASDIADLGQRARQFVQESYSWQTIAGQLIETYQWLLGGGAPPAVVRTR